MPSLPGPRLVGLEFKLLLRKQIMEFIVAIRCLSHDLHQEYSLIHLDYNLAGEIPKRIGWVFLSQCKRGL